jgi:flagellar hook-basal body complex protein FliE
MTVAAVSALAPDDEVLPSFAVSAQATEVPFGALVSEGLHALNDKLMASQADLQRLAVGDAANLHEVMIGLEESRIALQLALQVRTRVLEAYQDVMRMQV